MNRQAKSRRASAAERLVAAIKRKQKAGRAFSLAREAHRRAEQAFREAVDAARGKR